MSKLALTAWTVPPVYAGEMKTGNLFRFWSCAALFEPSARGCV
jgi:hypothetical protein